MGIRQGFPGKTCVKFFRSNLDPLREKPGNFFFVQEKKHLANIEAVLAGQACIKKIIKGV